MDEVEKKCDHNVFNEHANTDFEKIKLRIENKKNII
jgi:hypothetical protein